MKSLLFCMLMLEAKQPAPEALVEIYRQTIPCKAAAVENPASVPANQLNAYFVAQRAIWSVLSLEEFETLTETQARALQPGLLLEDLSTVISNKNLLQRLRAAADMGARPIAQLHDPASQSQDEMMLFWCGIGVCPEAFYLPRGISEQLALLVPGTYLTAPWFAGAPEWPLPHRRITLDGHDVIPLLSANEQVNGFVAQLGIPASNAPISHPVLEPILWQIAGVRFQAAQGQIDTSIPGIILTKLSRASLSIWPSLLHGQGQLLLWSSVGFAWLSFGLMIFNLGPVDIQDSQLA